MSLVAVVAIMVLLVSNAQRFYAVRVERTMEIDQVYDESMVVSFNITLPRACHARSLSSRPDRCPRHLDPQTSPAG